MTVSAYGTRGHNKKAHSGRYVVQHPKKYRGNIDQVFYRSGWELRFMKWCDSQPNVLEWGSEEVVVPYLSPVDGQYHRYFIDFYITIRDRSGNQKKFLIEIKPEKFTRPPVQPKRKGARYWGEVESYAVNQAKWQSAREFAEEADCEFLVLTETDLGLTSPKRT